MAYKVATSPTSEAFTVAYIKTWLKIPSSVVIEDALLNDMIKGARVWAEQNTGKAVMQETIEEYLDCFPCGNVMRLSVNPVSSVTSVSYFLNGAYTVFPNTNYYTDTVSEPARIVLKSGISFPSTDVGAPNVVKVVYVAGAATSSEVPKTIMDAMLQRIAFLYENREDIPVGGTNGARQRSADVLLSTNRTYQ